MQFGVEATDSSSSAHLYNLSKCPGNVTRVLGTRLSWHLFVQSSCRPKRRGRDLFLGSAHVRMKVVPQHILDQRRKRWDNDCLTNVVTLWWTRPTLTSCEFPWFKSQFPCAASRGKFLSSSLSSNRKPFVAMLGLKPGPSVTIYSWSIISLKCILIDI